jgi:hypothetical protein
MSGVSSEHPFTILGNDTPDNAKRFQAITQQAFPQVICNIITTPDETHPFPQGGNVLIELTIPPGVDLSYSTLLGIIAEGLRKRVPKPSSP